VHEGHDLNLGRSAGTPLWPTRKEAVSRQEPVYQGPSPSQPVHWQMSLLYHDCHRETVECRDEMRQRLEKPDRAGIERDDDIPVGQSGVIRQVGGTGWSRRGSGSG
jgi:hypothetical protein